MPFNSKGKLHGIGKSSHKFKYTYKDIADITGLKVETIRQYVFRKKFNPYNLASVVKFIAEYL